MLKKLEDDLLSRLSSAGGIIILLTYSYYFYGQGPIILNII